MDRYVADVIRGSNQRLIDSRFKPADVTTVSKAANE